MILKSKLAAAGQNASNIKMKTSLPSRSSRNSVLLLRCRLWYASCSLTLEALDKANMVQQDDGCQANADVMKLSNIASQNRNTAIQHKLHEHMANTQGVNKP